MSNIEKIDDHYTDLFDLIISQLNDKENYNDLLKIVTKQCDEIEDMLFDLLNYRWLDLATGVQLDLLGRIIGIERKGISDDEYRTLLNLKVIINTSSGEPESIISAVIGSFESINIVQYLPVYPGAYQLATDGSFGLDEDLVTELLQGISPAGVGFSSFLSDFIVQDGGDFNLELSVGGTLLVN